MNHTLVHHRFAEIEGRQVFYREAGDVTAPLSFFSTVLRRVRTCSAT